MKKMNKKGFTLIELLAVIVVLAIILVITVPTILNTLGSTRQDALQASADTIAKFYEDQLGLAALGKQQSGFVVDASFSNGKLQAKAFRNITEEEASILGLNTTDYALERTCKNTNISSNCYTVSTGDAAGVNTYYSYIKWDSNGKVTVTLYGAPGGKFTNGSTQLKAIAD